MERNRNSESGFTLIELLVVIVIISILATIALPSFLNQIARAREAGAKQTIGTVNRAQQTHRIESPTFAESIDDLRLGIDVNTEDYQFEIPRADGSSAEIHAIPKDPIALRAYTGRVEIVGGAIKTASCQSPEPSAVPPRVAVDSSGNLECVEPAEPMR